MEIRLLIARVTLCEQLDINNQSGMDQDTMISVLHENLLKNINWPEFGKTKQAKNFALPIISNSAYNVLLHAMILQCRFHLLHMKRSTSDVESEITMIENKLKTMKDMLEELQSKTGTHTLNEDGNLAAFYIDICIQQFSASYRISLVKD